jgi:hypothetical protein
MKYSAVLPENKYVHLLDAVKLILHKQAGGNRQ